MAEPFVITNGRFFTAGPEPGIVEGWIASDPEGRTWARLGTGPLPEELASPPQVDAGGQLVTPPLVDCHTHIVFGRDRSAEFDERLKGGLYEDILERGGGIHATVRMTAESTDDELIEGALRRVRALHRQGVSRIEVKTGYGLTLEAERRLLAVLAELHAEIVRLNAQDFAALPVTLHRTLLFHTVPMDQRGRRAEFVEELVRGLVYHAAEEGLAEAVDVFCDAGAFTLEESRRLLAAGAKAGLAPKIHAEQITLTGGAAMAANLGARSCDHLEMLDEMGAAAMAKSGSVAVLLPGAQLFLRSPAPPVALLREAGVPMAVATDCNPGSSMTTNITLMMSLACINMRLTPEEALLGVTANAERALTGAARHHSIAEGAPFGPLLAWPVVNPIDLGYRLGDDPVPHLLSPSRSETA